MMFMEPWRAADGRWSLDGLIDCDDGDGSCLMWWSPDDGDGACLMMMQLGDALMMALGP